MCFNAGQDFDFVCFRMFVPKNEADMLVFCLWLIGLLFCWWLFLMFGFIGELV